MIKKLYILTILKEITINNIIYKPKTKLQFDPDNSIIEDINGNKNIIDLHTLNLKYNKKIKEYINCKRII